MRDIGLVDAQITGGSWTGALVGTNAGTLDNVYATGSVAGSTNVGGLVGSNASSGTISQAYAAVAVSGSSNDVGGLVGLNIGTISNAYATGSVTGTQQVGGLVGNNYGGTVTSAYATGVVTGSAVIGGFVGSNTGTVTDGYWDISTDTTSGITAIGGGSATGITGRATVDLAAQLPTGFSASVWANGGNRTTPYLLANAGATGIGGHVILGTDTGATPTYYDVILNASQLQDIGSLGLAGHYLLGRSFDASATAGWNGGAGFAPIGDSTNRFTGVFDGLGYTIGNLHIDRPSSSNVGLFGYASHSTIRNVGLVGGSVNGKSIVGELVGANYSGSISNAYATGVVSGSNNVGGLAGGNSGTGTISNAYASGAVSARTSTSNNAGGLVGNNSATINDAYATGAVSGAIRRGGLVGINNGGTVSNAYAIGNVAGGTNAGALVGYNYGGTITNGYWDTATSTTTGVGKNTGTITGGSGLTTAALAAALPSGFSSSTWANAGNQTTPYLLANASLSSVGGHVILGTDASATPTGYDVIQTLTELQNINSTGLAGDYVLGNDIDASATASWNGGAGFIPIGGTSSNSASAYGTWSANPFTGTFDGLDHTISHLYINRPGAYISSALTYLTPAAGLFGYTSSTSIVSNIGLLNANIHGSYRVGALVGSNAGAVTNAYATGDVTGYWYVGGLVGSNTGPITGSYATATVSGTVNAVGHGISQDIGGLVGASSNATITGSYATGAVSFSTNATGFPNGSLGGLIGSDNQGTITGDYATGTVGGSSNAGSFVGGLIGTESGGTITGDYATGAVIGFSMVGGLIGSYKGGNSASGNTISDVYATGAVSAGKKELGGLIGYLTGVGSNDVTVSNAYATGNVSGLSGASDVGGLVGWVDTSATIRNTYATGSVVAGGSTVGGLVGLNSYSTVSNGYWDTTTGLTLGIGANYGTVTGGGGLTTAQLAAALPTGFDSGVWANGGNQTTPYLLANASFSTVGGHVILGTDTSATPSHYDVIQTLTQLQDINSTGLGWDYVLGNNIDASATASWNGGAGFVPIGSYLNDFTGIFDGLGHTISGLTIHRPSSSNVGLFGSVGGAAIRNVGLVGDSISGSYFVGGLVGGSAGSTISDVYATGSVSGGYAVGGLVGSNVGNSSISDAYATGSVSTSGGGNTLGGLVGSNSNSTISNAYASVSVSGASFQVGGLVGLNRNSTISHGYWDTTTGPSTGIGSSNGGTVTGGGGLSSAQMMQGSNFTGFDFSSPVWVIYNGHTAPLLNAFLTPLTVTASNQSQTYDGNSFGLSGATYSVAGADTSGHLFGLTSAYDGAVNVGSYSPDLWSDQQGYRITYVGGTLTITPKALTLSGLSADNKVYDGTAAATVASFGSLSGIVSGDMVSVDGSGSSASFADANAGTGKTVTVSGLALSGSSAGNYTLAGTDMTTADITPAPLSASLVGTISKVYDGTTDATLDAGNFQLTGFVGNQGASVTQTVGQYASSAVGTNIAVTSTLAAGDFTANAGTRLANYRLPTSASGVGSITAASQGGGTGGGSSKGGGTGNGSGTGTASANATASQSTAWGYAGVNGFALSLDPRLRWRQFALGKSSAVNLTTRYGAMPSRGSDGTSFDQSPCHSYGSIDPFATSANDAGTCPMH